MLQQVKTEQSFTKYFKKYTITFIGVFYGGEFECIEEAIYTDIETGNWIDISEFVYDFLPYDTITEIETEIINS